MIVLDCVNKVNFESGSGASDWSNRISHRKVRNMDWETRKGKGGTWNLHVLFNLGCVEWREETRAESQVSKGRSAGLSSSASLIYKVFTQVSDSQVFFLCNRTI